MKRLHLLMAKIQGLKRCLPPPEVTVGSSSFCILPEMLWPHAATCVSRCVCHPSLPSLIYTIVEHTVFSFFFFLILKIRFGDYHLSVHREPPDYM